MAKSEKRRLYDFSRKEMAKLCNCSSEKTFDNRLRKVCERYGIDTQLFKMDNEVTTGGENFFPVECAELLAVLVRTWEINPTRRENFNRNDLTAKDIADFYKKIIIEIDRLPASLKDLVKKLPSYFTTMEIIIWIERFVDRLSFFADLYMKEGSDDTGALLKELTVKIDKSSYILYSTKRLIDDATGFFTARRGGMGDKSITDTNVGIDVGIARLVEQISQAVNLLKEDIQYNKLEVVSDVEQQRIEIYQSLEKSFYLGHNIDTLERYCKGASGWKGMTEKIESGEYDTKELLIAYYEQEIAMREADIIALQQRVASLEGSNRLFPITFEGMKEINDAYVDVYKKATNTNNEVKKYTDQYVGRVLWSLLAEK